MKINLRSPGEGKGYEEWKIIKLDLKKNLSLRYLSCHCPWSSRPTPKLQTGTITKSTYELSWQEPQDNGGCKNEYYSIFKQEEGRRTWGLVNPKVTKCEWKVEDLIPETNYLFNIVGVKVFFFQQSQPQFLGAPDKVSVQSEVNDSKNGHFEVILKNCTRKNRGRYLIIAENNQGRSYSIINVNVLDDSHVTRIQTFFLDGSKHWRKSNSRVLFWEEIFTGRKIHKSHSETHWWTFIFNFW